MVWLRTPDYARKVISLWLSATLGDLLGCAGLLVWSFFFVAILASSSSQLSVEKAAELRPGPESSFFGPYL